jgi:hypothetical protein
MRLINLQSNNELGIDLVKKLVASNSFPYLVGNLVGKNKQAIPEMD